MSKQSLRFPDAFLEIASEAAFDADETLTTYLAEAALWRMAASRLVSDEQCERARRALDERPLVSRRGPRGGLPERNREPGEDDDD